MRTSWTSRARIASGLALLGLIAIGPFPDGGVTEARGADAPRVRVLGTVQDGGLPHFACSCGNCEASRTDSARRRHVAALALILPRDGSTEAVYLVDATPDIREQIHALSDLHPTARRVNRHPVDGILLTHAHIGHYTGLVFLGYESAHTRHLPVWATSRMCAFLSENGPWSQLVAYQNIDLRPVDPGQSLQLEAGVSVEPIQVPHRDEFADTVGYLIHGPASQGTAPGERITVLYVPDTDGWDEWDPGLLTVIARAGVDIALLDGTFFSTEELPGRPVESIGHPLIRDTMDLLEPMVREGALALHFIHLNHTNLALDPHGAAAAEIERRGCHIAAEGQELSLLTP